MSLKTRIEQLEQRTGPGVPCLADRVAAALQAGRERYSAMTVDQCKTEERARHERALAAAGPGPRASELVHRLYEANLRTARAYFALGREPQ